MLYLVDSRLEHQRKTGYTSEIKARELQSSIMEVEEDKVFRANFTLQRVLHEAAPRVELKLAPKLDPEKMFYEFAVRHEKAFLNIPDYWMMQTDLFFIASEAFLSVLAQFPDVNYQTWPVRIYLKNGERADREKAFHFCFPRDRVFVSDVPKSISDRDEDEIVDSYKSEKLTSLQYYSGGRAAHLLPAMIENKTIYEELSKLGLFGHGYFSQPWVNEDFMQACRDAKLTGLREYGSTKSGFLEGVGYVKYRY